MKRMSEPLTNLMLIVALVFAVPIASADEDGKRGDRASAPLILGVIDFPNSGAAAAQDAFERGVMLLHSFEFDDARAAFREAQVIDPGFAMAIWGEAMTLNHPLWQQQDRDTALEVLTKLPPKGKRKTTQREERYIAAIQVLYGEGSKNQRDVAYMNTMRRIYEDYPDDLEAASFYALSILGSVYERDFRTYMKAASIAEEVFARQPKHPGAAHYLIHSYDDPIHAPLGLPAARAYSEIAPAAAHAQHMVSHIYTSLGMWDEVVNANRTAVRVSEDSMRRAGKPVAMRSKHALHWLEYALLQQGRLDEARDTLLLMKEDLAAAPVAYQRRHSALMRASYVVEEPRGDSILAPVDPAGLPLEDLAVDAFASCFASIARGDLEDAGSELAKLQDRIGKTKVLRVEEGLHEDDSATSEDGFKIATIIARELQSLLYFHAGDAESALGLLAVALDDENSRPLAYGPPEVPKPASELMGEILLALDRPQDAAAKFEQSLSRNTNRTLSLLGLARAQEAAGDVAAAETWQKIAGNWHGDAAVLRGMRYSWLPAATTMATQ
jgi:tetratricopeptide (TPR) repeat protein